MINWKNNGLKVLRHQLTVLQFENASIYILFKKKITNEEIQNGG
jgi:hypothetical protein